LAHLGLVDDALRAAEARATATTLRRISALIAAICLGTGLALGVLWLGGVDVAWQTPVALAVVFLIASAAAASTPSPRRRRSRD